MTIGGPLIAKPLDAIYGRSLTGRVNQNTRWSTFRRGIEWINHRVRIVLPLNGLSFEAFPFKDETVNDQMIEGQVWLIVVHQCR